MNQPQPEPMSEHALEIRDKLALMRCWLVDSDASVIRLRGTDWFAWATAGGSSVVLQSAETGVAEVLVSAQEAYVLTDEIEAQRLQLEEAPAGFQWHVIPWDQSLQREQFVIEVATGGLVLSDRPGKTELPLPEQYYARRMCLSESEQRRYRHTGTHAAAAMTRVMHAARPDWSEFELAGAGAQALWNRGLQPLLVLAAGAERMRKFRHPVPTKAALGGAAMLVFCARGSGLIVSLTRFVYFSAPDAMEQNLHGAVRVVEEAGLQACSEGRVLSDVYRALHNAYRDEGFPHAIHEHHQGGIGGYLAREIIATSKTGLRLENGMAIALNPSLPGAKIEDTFLLQKHGLENITLDSAWPTAMQNGRSRPLPLEAA